MRTILELLKVMLDNVDYFETGLCKWGLSIYFTNLITLDEFRCIYNHIYINQPADAGESYFWPIGEIAPRINWINEQIKKFE